MKNDDYKTDFEEHRKEIGLDDGHDISKLPSRSELHRKGRKPKKKSSHTMINVILGLFTLIPVLILVYIISDFYTPGDRTSAKGGDTGTLFEMNSEKPVGNTTVADKDDEKKATSKEEEKSAEKTEPEAKVEEKPVSKPVVNVNPAPEKKPEVKVEPKPEKKPEVKPEPKPVAKTHTVGSNENLYRISLKYYGNGDGVDKIKSANGLSSNEIGVGQTLVIP
ncbi:LysM peptidoglycan-binding domain-containing protein [Sporosarcina sp. E16_8]|uniref:LysM peptidoglycan-binding domain-containing protein n=1 Tax=Sporosarcina sp. E16_8 TaxID=2789295 RepID=UPI001A918BEE|nr:LysM peptidoglycan-binding domain-containing protein [Sporosarcina sp. E16_8]MBO0586607.1 LysM peptidoglycan-binding domain-containing protein [Sporosarcina sp. E16_8]